MNPTQPIKKNGFNFEWQNSDLNNTDLGDGFRRMRVWQLNAFEQLKTESYMILNAPMASGKSWMMCLLSAFKMKNNTSLRTIIVVPQTIIGSGFADAKIQMPDGERLHWQIKHNLCRDEFSKGTVNYFIRWLEKPSDIFSERSLLCTHATLVAAYRKLKAENRLHLFKNILLWVDEAHHIKNVVVEGFDGAIINNGIGELISFFLDNNITSIQIGLTTASFFRGDRASLLTDSMEAKFKRFNLPCDEYLKTMTYLKSFSFDFLLSGHNYAKGIEHLIQERKGKDIIYIPHPVSQFSTGNKLQEVGNIINIYGDVLYTTHDGVMIVSGKRGELKILDLVNEVQRKQKKNYLDNPIVNKQSDGLDAIISLGMFKEGANWIYADRSIIVGARSSLVDVLQMIGRLLRDVEGKSHVEVFQLLPFSLDQQDKEAFRENLNNYLKAIYASLILENILNPVKIKATQKVEKEKNEKEENNKVNWLNAALPDDTKQQLLIEEVRNHLFDIMSENKKTINDVHLLYDEYSKIMPEILENYGITEHKQEVAKQIWGISVRRTMQLQGLSVENIDFDIIQEIHPLGFLLRYSSGISNVHTFEKLREAIEQSRIWMPFEEAREFARNLKLKTQNDWFKHFKNNERPKDIPAYPNGAYSGKGWITWGDWLGTGRIASQNYKYRSFEEARTFVRSLGLKNNQEWRAWTKSDAQPRDIPTAPDRIYSDQGWISWGDFLGTKNIGRYERTYREFNEVKTFVRELGFKSRIEWEKWLNSDERPDDIPSNPSKVYKNEWNGWGDFLGTGTIAHFEKNFRPFEEARNFARNLLLPSKVEWAKWTKTDKRPSDIPSEPSRTYAKQGWLNWKDWLGTSKKKN